MTLALSVAAADLLSKVWASHALKKRAIDLPGPLDLRLAHNSGVAFSFLAAAPPVVIVALTSLVAIASLMATDRGGLPLVGGALIAGGAIGNIVDRIEGGSVVDMLHTSFWPTFNAADVAISCGATLCVAGFMKTRRTTPTDPSIS